MRVTSLVVLSFLAIAASCSSTQSELTGPSPSPETSEPTPTLVAPSTTEVPTPTPRFVTSLASLLNAIPPASKLPLGWTDYGSDPDTEFYARTGTGFGYCGGPNSDQRALNANSTASVYKSDWATGVDGQFASLSLYAFGNEDDAAAFMASSERAISSCGYEELEVPEFVEGRDDATTDYRVDLFEGSFEPAGKWSLDESTALGGAAAEGADEAFSVRNVEVFLSKEGNVTYGTTESVISQYERHSTVVFVLSIDGVCCEYGFSNAGESEQSDLPVYETLRAAADHLRPLILTQLMAGT